VHTITADFNKDGNQDFATANNGSDDVSVALGNGNGIFDAPQEYATEEGPYSLTTADFNQDGDLDIAAANQFTRTGGGPDNDKGTVSVLSGNGDGTFVDQVVRDTGDGPVGITSGLFNDDDLYDISTANFGAGGPERETDTVAVLLGEPAQCSDGIDNDSDGEADFPADLGCGSEGDNTENSTPPSLSISDATVTEGDTDTTNATFTVTRSGDKSDSSTVDYATQEGSATEPEDYTRTSGTLTFDPGETSKEIQVPVKGDTQDEPEETFQVNLSAPTGATISDGEGTGTITDNDPTPPPPTANLALGITDSPTEVRSGRTVTYTLTVTNEGDDPANNVKVELTIPRGTEYISPLPSGCTETGTRVVTCNLGEIASGSSKSRRIEVKVNRNTSFTVSANTSSSTTDTDPSNNTETERTRVR
jgi:uncharacterized repeat protein (TIGR01451 family)